MADIEGLQLQLDSLLCLASEEKLSDLVEYLKIEETIEGKSKFNVIKLLRNSIEKTLSTPGNIDLDVFLQDAVAFMTDTPPPLEQTQEERAVSNLERQLEELKLSHQKQLESLLTAIEETKQSNDNAPKSNKPPLLSPPSLLRREFKIAGQIGEPGQLDKLTYVSLTHQIDSGVEKGYSEREIVDAVIKSISPHSSLRNYVLTLPDRSLAKLRSILRVFFQEKTAADLYQALVTSTQKPKETPQQFVLRALDARNKVFFASQEEKCANEYSSQLVQNTFLKTVETGLRDESLITNLRPILKTSGVTDEELMKNINELTTTQAERKAKGNLSTDRQKIAAAQAEFLVTNPEKDKPPKIQQTQKAEKVQNSTTNLQQQLEAQVQELKSELASLRRSFQGPSRYQPETPTLGPRFQNYRGRGRGRGRGQFQTRFQQYGCRACQAGGFGNTCQHCFKCGNIGHVRSQCPTNEQPGNANRLLQGGEE